MKTKNLAFCFCPDLELDTRIFFLKVLILLIYQDVQNQFFDTTWKKTLSTEKGLLKKLSFPLFERPKTLFKITCSFYGFFVDIEAHKFQKISASVLPTSYQSTNFCLVKVLVKIFPSLTKQSFLWHSDKNYITATAPLV